MNDRLDSCSAATPHGVAATVNTLGDVSRIFEPECHLVRLRRPLPPELATYLDMTTVHAALRALPRGVFIAGETLDPAMLPDGPGRDPLIDDVRQCGELLCDLTGSARFGVRIEVLDRAMCPRWHVDQVSLRLLVTWRGPATEWLDDDCADRTRIGTDHILIDARGIHRADAGDLLLLKGRNWPGQAGRGVLHRSPEIADDAPRIVAAFDAIW
ncbi:DUF1826 domain-containing protein [Methyloversatilis thermotolerans]|uniref:DUF1826 domain-containing protein n=1 Tax=Methyloversatilis thermotolerans TaxID=1346290 RepID=UPI000376F69E|nr:DUF1826 domain-containing protein [Methyloversatilis thermotolerans]